MRTPALLQHPVCLVVGHVYTAAPRTSHDEAVHWACRRCGAKRYRPPPDFLDGAGGIANYGSGG